ncbi:hypothetical protein K469DRAFT_708615 [Zopfia rhizophila CBS 207.26]|uniref:Uncharacterized protein n=1 Tax=Zopfia rhizophila CBS 207.26 TaxID=1314779 RepID=A0A6A6DYU3_9PEZI|nr:hypothetical protein K469DRAFT_708615 [Zopfia rhizophila CBS 207.26]
MYTVVRRTRGPPPGSLEKERNPYLSAPDMDDEKERSNREEHVYTVVRQTREPPPVPTPPIQPGGYSQGSGKLLLIPLERERKPYTVREDTGKLYGTKFPTDPPGALKLSTADLIPRLSAGAIAA